MIKVLVLAGDGLNCEEETALAFEMSQAQAHIKLLRDLIQTPEKLLDYDILALPGGFSYGDELGSGKIMALQFRHGLERVWEEFINSHRLVIGICNGFQILAQCDAFGSQAQCRLAVNASEEFINRWEALEVNPESPCLWTRGLSQNSFELPIRHGEGRVVFSHTLQDHHPQIPLRYRLDVNGSQYRAAGVCDPSGRIFGLMPHPEAACKQHLSYDPQRVQALGLNIFQAGVKSLCNKNP